MKYKSAVFPGRGERANGNVRKESRFAPCRGGNLYREHEELLFDDIWLWILVQNFGLYIFLNERGQNWIYRICHCGGSSQSPIDLSSSEAESHYVEIEFEANECSSASFYND
eukprot:98919-Amorphochlora_amoeboformis.AAC.1